MSLYRKAVSDLHSQHYVQVFAKAPVKQYLVITASISHKPAWAGQLVLSLDKLTTLPVLQSALKARLKSRARLEDLQAGQPAPASHSTHNAQRLQY